MNVVEKAAFLGEAGRWDSCGGMSFTRSISGSICASESEAGECCRLFKTLMTNDCAYDCRYCQNSAHRAKQPVSYEPKELAKVFMHLYESNLADGLFLTSGIAADPDRTTEKMLEAVRLVRIARGFRGYIHFKILPGTSRELVRQASEYANRLSVNMEAPSKSRLSELSSVKDFRSDIIRRQAWIREFRPSSGQTTQMIVGAGSESDMEILKAAAWEYDRLGVARVYYSAFTPIAGTPLESRDKTPSDRERRLYCADFLLRRYGIGLGEISEIADGGNLPLGDPKVHLALRHFDGQVDLNSASYEDLVRVPGIGLKSAQAIMELRDRGVRVTRRVLGRMGVSLSRAMPFLKLDGMAQSRINDGYN